MERRDQGPAATTQPSSSVSTLTDSKDSSSFDTDFLERVRVLLEGRPSDPNPLQPTTNQENRQSPSLTLRGLNLANRDSSRSPTPSYDSVRLGLKALSRLGFAYSQSDSVTGESMQRDHRSPGHIRRPAASGGDSAHDRSRLLSRSADQPSNPSIFRRQADPNHKRRSNLPWLDGDRQKANEPDIPGAFVDDELPPANRNGRRTIAFGDLPSKHGDERGGRHTAPDDESASDMDSVAVHPSTRSSGTKNTSRSTLPVSEAPTRSDLDSMAVQPSTGTNHTSRNTLPIYESPNRSDEDSVPIPPDANMSEGHKTHESSSRSPRQERKLARLRPDDLSNSNDLDDQYVRQGNPRPAPSLALLASAFPHNPPYGSKEVQQASAHAEEPQGPNAEQSVNRQPYKHYKSRPDSPVSPGTLSPRARAMNRSIASLEHLIHEAEQLAQSTAQDKRQHEVPSLLHDAANAVHEASKDPDGPHRAVKVPLGVGGGAVPYEDTSSSSRSHEGTSTYSDNSSVSTSPQLMTPPAIFDNSAAGRPVIQPPASAHSSHKAEPTANDFAYPQTSHELDNRESSARNGPVRKRAPRLESKRSKSPLEQANVGDASEHGHSSGRQGRLASISGARPMPTQPPELDHPTGANQHGYGSSLTSRQGQDAGHNWGSDKYNEKDYLSSDALKGKHHISLGPNQQWSIHHHRRQPIARNWATSRKRFTATVACINTGLIGLLIGIYAGEVPAIQYTLLDTNHRVILGNVVLYLGMAITTFLFWPLPLLHGRKPYTLLALGLALPLQFPQAVIVLTQRDAENIQPWWVTGLLLSRALSGFALGFAHINFKTTLLDLFGASLQSTHPHGEVVTVDDVRRHGGGMGMWIGIWSFASIGSLSFGFFVGADIISGANVAWGFFISVILIALVLLLDVMAPETRRAPHRRTMQEIELPNMSISRRVARGEIRMHVKGDGPKWWWEECAAGVYLSLRMLDQPGFFLMALYLGWVYGQIILIIVVSSAAAQIMTRSLPAPCSS